jgi:hypothetical protein
MSKRYSSAAPPSGQPVTGRSRLRITAFSLLIGLICLGAAGCRNPYRQTQSLYPADRGDRLELRIAEAQQAEQRADQADTRLRKQSASSGTDADMQVNLDRLEAASLDFKRRVASARDAARDWEHPGHLDAELDRLEQRSSELLEEVRRLRAKTAAVGTVTP